MNFMGLDLSLVATGVAVIGDSPYMAEINTKPHAYKNSIMRVDHIADEILVKVRNINPESIMIEGYFVGRNPKAVISLTELGFCVRYRLLDAGYSFMSVVPTSLKKFVTGCGNCGKDIMVKEVFKRWGVDTSSNNIADAIGLAHMGMAVYNMHHGIAQDLTKFQLESLKFHVDPTTCIVSPYKKM